MEDEQTKEITTEKVEEVELVKEQTPEKKTEVPKKKRGRGRPRKDGTVKKTTTSNADNAQFKKMAVAIINQGLEQGINQAVLKQFKEKITVGEIEASQFSESVMGALMFYFPGMSIDHPLLIVAVSGFMLSSTVMQKMSMGKVENGRHTENDRENSSENNKAQSNDNKVEGPRLIKNV